MLRFQSMLLSVCLFIGVTHPVFSADSPAVNIDALVDQIDIPFEKFVLSNGLTLIVHEDHKAPIVAVNIWYHVGSKDEKPGKTGFAHLFEHLMFNGSEHFNDDYFKVMEKLGATSLNGTTSNDRTNYFQNVPVSALDTALWMESDRMGHLLGAIDQAKLDEQRGVVQNEKRQGENQPYGKVWEILANNTFPEGHPYSWEVIGSMEDLDAASLDDVKEWFQKYYGSANAVICIAGDIDPQTAKEKVEKYFGDIPSGPPLTKQQSWVAKREGSHRAITYDRVPQALFIRVWNVPQWGTPESDYLSLVADVLSSGKNSRFYKRLVYEDQIATDVSAFVYDRQIAGQFMIQATVQPGGDIKAVEKAIGEELAKFLAEGPAEEELYRVKMDFVSGFVRGIERIGGFGGKSDQLITNQVFTGDPGFYKVTLERVVNASAKDLKETAQKWLTDGDFTLEVHPFPAFIASASGADRTQIPEAAAPPDASLPLRQETSLDNGLKIILAERHAIPVVHFRLVADAGFAADHFASPGVANLAMNMMDEGTETRSALEISEQLDLIGASLSTGSSLDASFVHLSALTTAIDPSLDIFSDVVLRPSFPEKELERLRKETLAGIQQEKVNPDSMTDRVLPQLLYGKDHVYSQPLTGSGTEESVSKITVQDLQKFHGTWFKPNNVTLIVVGDTTLEKIVPKIKEIFGSWEKGEVPQKNLSDVQPQEKVRVFLMDRPESLQSVIIAGHLAPPKANPNEVAIETLNHILGGSFTSRINMNLREDKHWSYGSGSSFMAARGPRPFSVQASVQTDKTKEAMQEIRKELTQILETQPPTPEELSKTQATRILSMAGQWETAGAVSGTLMNILQYNLPPDYYEAYPSALRSITTDRLQDIAKQVLHPNQLTWVVVGDLSKIRSGIEELNLGPIQVLDADGEVIQ